MPHFHISGIQALMVFLYVAVIFGTLHMLCAAHPENRLSQAWIGLGF